MLSLADFSDSQPPLDLKFEPTFQPMTIEELRAIRKAPTPAPFDRLIRLILFLVIGVPRFILSFAYAFITTIFFSLVVTLWHMAGAPEPLRRPLQILWSALARILLFLLGFVRIRFYGEVDSEARFLVSNHLCFFDNWLFLPLFPRPLDKVEVLQIPAIKAVFDVFRGMTVDRTRSMGMAKVVLETAADVSQPMIQMFPEGTTTNGEYMLRFHLGAFLSDLPVQPAAIRYHMWGSSRRFSNLSYFHRNKKDWISFFSIPFITVDVAFLDCCSLKANQENDPRLFADEVSMAIAQYLGIPVMDISSSALFKRKET